MCHHKYEKFQGALWTLLLSSFLPQKIHLCILVVNKNGIVKKKKFVKNVLLEWQTKKGLAWDFKFCYGYAILLQISRWMQISQDDACIAFKLHNFVQINLLTSMWRTLQYPHFLESICLASYNEHGISILKDILLFHGLQYYRKMMWIMLAF